jgi:pyroglutamyl-peptidase
MKDEVFMKVVVTGFEPFSPWQRNPSGEAAHHLDGVTIAGLVDLPPLEITGLVLPVAFRRAAAPLITAIDELHPAVVLNLGQADTTGIKVERIAVNRCEGKDNDGYDPRGKPIAKSGPETYHTLLPVDEIVKMLSKNKFNAEISDSAGTFLCNYVMYTTLHHIATRQLRICAGFIHAPPLREEVPDSTNSKAMLLEDWIDFTMKILDLLRTLV